MTEAQQTAAETYRDARDWLQLLIGSESRALVCTASDGSERAFVAYQMAVPVHNGLMFVELPNPPAHPDGHIVTETAVTNAIERCQPDVRMADEKDEEAENDE